jgi:hypothetical protein
MDNISGYLQGNLVKQLVLDLKTVIREERHYLFWLDTEIKDQTFC